MTETHQNPPALEPARNVWLDIRFLQPEGLRIAPMLRTAAGYTYGTTTTREEFIDAAVRHGYNAATAGVCWAAGRKFMMLLDQEG